MRRQVRRLAALVALALSIPLSAGMIIDMIFGLSPRGVVAGVILGTLWGIGIIYRHINGYFATITARGMDNTCEALSAAGDLNEEEPA